MRKSVFTSAKVAIFLGSTAFIPSLAFSQTAASTAALPVRTYVDENGVDLYTGMTVLRSPVLKAGASQHLQYYQIRGGGIGYKDNLQGAVAVNGTTVTVSIGETSEIFNANGVVYTPAEQRGSTLTGGGTSYVYKTADGTTFNFSRDPTCSNCRIVYTQWGDTPVIHSIVYADGGRLDFNWESTQIQVGQTPAGPVLADVRRVIAIRSNDGYALNFRFSKLPSSGDFAGSTIVSKVTAFNIAQDGCSTGANCTSTAGRPSLTINQTSYTDSLNRTTIVGTGSIRRPGSSTDNVTYAFDGTNRVSQVAADGVNTAYTYADSGDIRTVTVARASAPARVVTFNIAQRSLRSDTDPTGRKSSFEYDTSARLTKAIAPENNYTIIGYDGRGNATSSTSTGKTGATISISASYPCTIAAACNDPMTTTDARNNVTNYDYDPSSGLLIKITAPAAENGVRPEKRLSYTQVGGVWRVTGTSECRTAGPSACAGGADETKATISYAGATALPATVTVGAGDNSHAATVSMIYDAMGHLLTRDGPLPSADDTTRYYYDVEGQLLGTVGPDPDGAGTLLRRAVRNTFNQTGQITLVEAGTATDQSDNGLSNMTVLQSSSTFYDSNSRKIATSMSAGGTVFAYGQIGYDNRGRVNCVVTRMNSGAFGGTGDACALGPQGNFGADRITQIGYDDANRYMTKITALGTAEATTERMTYTTNGQAETVTDGNGNITRNAYDGFDRLQTTTYLDGSYEQLGYDANGNVTSQRKRDGRTLTSGYDALNRMTSKAVPNARSVFYAYDLTGAMTEAHFDSLGGADYIKNAYNALGQVLTSTTSMGGSTRALSYTYDAAGNRAQITYPDGTAFRYDYDNLGRLNHLKDGANNQVGLYVYLDNGKLTWRGQGANGTGYGYDAIGRILSYNMQRLDGGSVTAVNTALAYNAASQIVQQTLNSDAYAYTDTRNVDLNFASNGLNQYTSVGANQYSYDANGNLTSDGGNTYTYDAENRLTGVSGARSGSLIYDPIGRLWQTSGTSGVTQFLYDGDQLVAEYNNTGGLLRRYVQGTGNDDPLLWYEGASTSPYRLYTDHLGSVVGIIQDDGTMRKINTYDEYGVPGSGNLGRFQYTGQAYIPELGMYYYKARMYSPMLGRFMQTDPIGYGDGLNMYNYVGGDPVNKADPSGLAIYYFQVCKPAEVGGLEIQGYAPMKGIQCYTESKFVPDTNPPGNQGPASPPTPPQQPSVPQSLIIDKSCAGTPIVNDPKAQQKMRDAMGRSLNPNLSNGREEWAFWGGESFGGGYDYTESFTDHITNQVDVASRQPGHIASWLDGNWKPRFYFHTHPNSRTGSGVSPDDVTAAQQTGSTAIAVDRTGRVTCGK